MKEMDVENDFPLLSLQKSQYILLLLGDGSRRLKAGLIHPDLCHAPVDWQDKALGSSPLSLQTGFTVDPYGIKLKMFDVWLMPRWMDSYLITGKATTIEAARAVLLVLGRTYLLCAAGPYVQVAPLPKCLGSSLMVM